MENADILVVGAGAAGLAAGIFAAEAAAGCARIVLLDGAAKPGAKILVSGGGRCNVTNARVTPEDYWGGPRTIVRSVLRAFDEQRTIAWMRGLGVELKLEPTGKYFPVSDSARTVLAALLAALSANGALLVPGARVQSIQRDEAGGFRVGTSSGQWTARRLVMATGGLSLPKSGSDGWGLATARRLGHSVTPTTPALSPLVLAPGRGLLPHADLSGITVEARLEVARAGGCECFSWTDSLLFTHFGLSGPAALNASRHFLRAALDAPAQPLLRLGHPLLRSPAEADAWLLRAGQSNPRRSVAAALGELWPARMADAIAALLEWQGPLSQLPREPRRSLAATLAGAPLHCTGDRGYSFAETTAGGVDLQEVDPRTMESRVVPGLHLCGEMLDVDGRIGGFNFQWAWATGYLAGRACARAFAPS